MTKEGIKLPPLRVPGYVGLEGIKKPNELARKEAAAQLVGPESFCSLGYMFFKGKIIKAAE